MSYAYGGPLLAGAYAYGGPGLGVLAELVASGGLDGPGYPYPGLAFPADNGKQISAVITRWPTLGTLTVYDDFSFSYTGASDYALYALKVDGAASTDDIGYGPGIGRLTLNTDASGGTLSGNVTAADATAAGSLSSGGVSQLGGNVDAGPARPGGGLAGARRKAAAVSLRRLATDIRPARTSETDRS